MCECIIEKKAVSENIEEISSLADIALAGLNMSEKFRNELIMALDEAVTNVVLHGYSGKDGNIKIIINRSNNVVSLELVDTGVKFNPTTYPEPNLKVPIEERKAGGMGVQLVRKFTDDMKYYYKDGENHLILIKKTGE